LDIPLSDVNHALELLSKGEISPVKYQLQSDIDSLKPSSLRAIKRKASLSVTALLEGIAPGQSDKLQKLICLDDGPKSNDVTDTTVVRLIAQLYEDSQDSHVKKQLLSMICSRSTKRQLQELIPTATTYAVDQARQHAAEVGPG
jgi:predicted DNA-binding ribbon-helix-helix protein